MGVEFLRKERYDFNDLVQILKILRGEGGCPWDREQDHHSIRRDFLEETYEVLEAIDNEDPVLLQEELGDVLLQVVFHAQIECEISVFDIDDVCNGICQKMILRHPHVFADTVAKTTEDVLTNWDNIKQQEKGQTTKTDTLLSIPKTFPALMRAQKLQSRAKKAGLDLNRITPASQAMHEAVTRLDTAMEQSDPKAVEKALGEAMFSLVSVARNYDLDPEFSLSQQCDAFLKQFATAERLAQQQQRALAEVPQDQQKDLWDMAKEKNL